MPPSPAYPETVRTTMVYTLPNTDVAENVLHWSVGAGATVDSTFATDLAFQISEAWSGSVKDKQSTSVKLLKIIVEDLRTVPYFRREYPVGVTGNTASSAVLPMQLSAVLSLHTVHAGRRGRGRVYVPGFCEDSNAAGGVIEAATITAVLAFGTALDAIETADSQDVLWGVLSRSNSATYAVDAWTCDNRWDVQRRRANRRVA